MNPMMACHMRSALQEAAQTRQNSDDRYAGQRVADQFGAIPQGIDDLRLEAKTGITKGRPQPINKLHRSADRSEDITPRDGHGIAGDRPGLLPESIGALV